MEISIPYPSHHRWIAYSSIRVLPILRTTFSVAVVVQLAGPASGPGVAVGEVDSFVGSTGLKWACGSKVKEAEGKEGLAEKHFE